MTNLPAVSIACFLKVAHPASVRVLAQEGALSHLILDAEHGAFTDADLEVLCGLIRFLNKESIVRIPSCDAFAVARALDRGARGVMIPRAGSALQVAEAVRGLSFIPTGSRGWDPTCAASDYGRGDSKLIPQCYVQVETIGALEEAADIAKIPGVTDLFVGPADLSRALGSEEIFSPRVLEAIADIARLLRDTAVRLGVFLDSPSLARWAYQLGYRFFAVTSDVALLARGIREATVTMTDLASVTEDGRVG